MIAATAAGTALVVDANYQVGLGALVVVGAAIVCGRFPAASVTVVVLLTGAFGTLTAFFNFPVGPAVDVILGGLWLSVVWRLVTGERPRWWVPPAVMAIVAYLCFTAVEIAFAASPYIGVQSYRASAWYLAAAVLVAYAPWSQITRVRIARGIVAVALAVGLYAIYRWVVGAAPEEASLAREASYTNTLGGELGLVGSFTGRHELGTWCALAIPPALIFALTFRGRWRVVAALAAAVCAFALLGSEARAALVAVVPGLLLAFLLFQFSRGFPGLHLGATATALIAVLALGVFMFSSTAGTSERATSHYQLILTPGQDPAYKRRLYKWETALKDIGSHPLGKGLGTAGRVQQKYARFTNVATFDIDSSYLKIALEQGFWTMIVYIAALVALLFSLTRRALLEPSRERAGLAIAGAAALLTMGLLMIFSVAVEGLPALFAWLLVGLGLGAVAVRDPETS